MITLKFWTQIDPTKTLPTDDASQAHLVALAADVVRAVDAPRPRDPVEAEVDAMFAEVSSW